MTETGQLKPGDIFAAKYRIERFLGKGGMSTVYEATNLMLQSRVALKVLIDELAAVTEAVERFVREGIAASRVRHRAVVQIYDAGDEKGLPWIAMEFIEGETLADRFKARGTLPPVEVLEIAKEVASGLAAAHDQGVIHRDLKPHNVVLDCAQFPPQPKILDFGIAKLGDPGMAKLTQTGFMMGTPHYMSPEQARGDKEIGATADFWALGVIMLEGISGHMPYEAESVAVYLGKLITTPHRDVRSLAPSAPEPVVRLIERCLSPEPASRPQSARELMAEIDQVLKSLPADRSSDLPAQPVTVADRISARPAPEARPPAQTAIAQVLVQPAAPPPSPQSALAQTSLSVVPGALPSPVEPGTTLRPAAPTEPGPRPRNRRILAIVGALSLLGVLGVVAVGLAVGWPRNGEPPGPAPATQPTPPATQPTPPTTQPTPPTTQPTPPVTQPAPPTTQPPDPATLRPPMVFIQSEPPGADVYINNAPLGARTPTVVSLPHMAHIEVRLAGYTSAATIYSPGPTEVMLRLVPATPRPPRAKTSSKGFGAIEQRWRDQQKRAQKVKGG